MKVAIEIEELELLLRKFPPRLWLTAAMSTSRVDLEEGTLPKIKIGYHQMTVKSWKRSAIGC